MNNSRNKAIYDIAIAPVSAVMPAAPANVDFYGEDVFKCRCHAHLPPEGHLREASRDD